MFAQNTHLDLMESDRSITNTWCGHLRFFRADWRPLDSKGKKRFEDFIIGSPETGVRQVDILALPFAAHIIVADLVLEGGATEFEAVLEHSVTSAMGGLLCAGFEPEDTWPQSVYLAPLQDLPMDILRIPEDDRRHDVSQLPETKKIIYDNMKLIREATAA